MKYTHIILSGYVRMLLNGFNHFEMKIESPLQLILGTNGCGKSSLMWELSPLPANKDDFLPNGYKTVHIEHNGHHYELTSRFAGKQEHDFVFDGEEQNKSHLVSLQKELVKKHFGITQDIHELMTGRLRFTAMDVGKRKEWLLRLCDTNYDYALHIYNQMRGAQRDRTGAIRMEKKALVAESEKMLQDDEVIRLQQEARQLHEILSMIAEHRKPLESDSFELEIEDKRQDRQLTALAVTLTGLQQRIEDREHTDDELTELIAFSANQVLIAQTRISMLAEQHDKIQQKIAVLQKTGQHSIASLEADLQRAEDLVAKHKSDFQLLADVADPQGAFTAFSSLKPLLMEIYLEVPENKERKYSSAQLVQARDALAEHNRIKNNLLEQLADRKASLAHMREHMGKPDVVCPKCEHAFSMVYSEASTLTLTDNIRSIEERLQTQLYPAIQEMEQYIQTCNQYASLFRQYGFLQSGAPALRPYWDYLADKKVFTDAPQSGPGELERIERDLQQQLKVAQLQQLADDIRANLEMLKSVGDADLDELKLQNEQLETELAEQTQAQQSAQSKAEAYKAQFALRREALNIRKSIRKLIQAKRDLHGQTLVHHLRSIQQQLVRDLTSALGSREHLLHAAGSQKLLVQSMTEKIARLSQEEQTLSILVKELSPTEGLIAEGILGFIKNFCDQMNALIDRVWTYPLVIQSCEMLEGEALDLDYRFPMLVGEQENLVGDVSKASEGMQEIIDLAFRLTAMHYLGLEEVPLYLDEFGRPFDKTHRSEAALLIRNLIEQKAFTNVFMCSHYESMYGALSNPQVCALNTANITLPREYNQHVTMR